MIAKRASGKSWVCRSILRHFRDIPVGIIIAPTEKMANPPFYSEFFPDTYIHYEYRSEIIEKLVWSEYIIKYIWSEPDSIQSVKISEYTIKHSNPLDSNIP